MQYDKTFKEEAVRLSDEIGPKKAADQLGFHIISSASEKNVSLRKAARIAVEMFLTVPSAFGEGQDKDSADRTVQRHEGEF